MLKIINEELMAYSTITTTEKGKKYTKLKVGTSNKLQQYENDNNRKSDNQRAPKKQNGVTASIASNNDVLVPINREIIRISAPFKNIEDFMSQPEDSKEIDFGLPMSINVIANNKYQPHVDVRCHEQGDDRVNMYVVAFPFNGMLKPIPENPQYRIYKGLIASSVRPFYFNNRKYRKVLYLVIEINKNLFNSDHKYHTDKIDIQLESYALFVDRETEEKKTNCEFFKLSILSADGEYETEWNYETVNEAIMMAAEPGQQLWVTYNMNNNRNMHNNTNDNNRKKFTKQKPVTMEGDMMVTTNKHGIRKEIPIKNKNTGYHNNNPRYSKPSNGQNISTRKDSIEQMMMESGMFDNDYNGRSKRNGGSKNGKRKKDKNSEK